MTRRDQRDHQLTLLPRDHAKSTLIAYRAAWEVIKDPTIRILYISSTANLAEKQLGLIKQILSSSVVRRYWPELVNEDEGKREKWTQSEISVDDPRRMAEAIRDPTVFTGGLTTSLTGMHCDLAILDDVVVIENAYTEEEIRLLNSILSLPQSKEPGHENGLSALDTTPSTCTGNSSRWKKRRTTPRVMSSTPSPSTKYSKK